MFSNLGHRFIFSFKIPNTLCKSNEEFERKKKTNNKRTIENLVDHKIINFTYYLTLFLALILQH